jgi:hypothetical protein
MMYAAVDMVALFLTAINVRKAEISEESIYIMLLS